MKTTLQEIKLRGPYTYKRLRSKISRTQTMPKSGTVRNDAIEAINKSIAAPQQHLNSWPVGFLSCLDHCFAYFWGPGMLECQYPVYRCEHYILPFSHWALLKYLPHEHVNPLLQIGLDEFGRYMYDKLAGTLWAR